MLSSPPDFAAAADVAWKFAKTCGWLGPVRLRLTRRRQDARCNRRRLRNEGVSPRTEAASKITICNCLLEACVDWIGRRLSHVNWLKVGDVCLEPSRTVSLEERVRDVPRVVLRRAVD